MCDQDFKTSQTPSLMTDPLFYFLNRFKWICILENRAIIIIIIIVIFIFLLLSNYNYSCSYTTVGKVYNREQVGSL